MRDYEYQFKMAKRVGVRYDKWVKENKFEWTDENVRRIIALNNALMEKENKLYELFVKVKKKHRKADCGRPFLLRKLRHRGDFKLRGRRLFHVNRI